MNVTSNFLNKIIAAEIKDEIETFWRYNRVYWLDWNYYFGGQEVKAFIFSSPYFSQDLKEFLYDKDSLVVLEVTKEWYDKFLESIYLWTESVEWLCPDIIFTSDISRMDDVLKLDLAPHNKAILSNKKYF